MPSLRHLLFGILLCATLQAVAQSDITVSATAKADTLINTITDIPKKYLSTIDDKLDKYTTRVTNKTEKTLTKLAKLETKIKTLLEKASPETAQRLFSNSQLTFAAALEKYKQGQSIITDQRKKYNEYRDKLTTTIKYLEDQKDKLDTKLLQPLAKAKEELKEYETMQDETDAMEQFIKERKKQLVDQSLQYLGKSKYLQKINKEAYYYVETIRNYKQIFTDKQKAEETALTILNKIPAFQKFMQQNSMLASLFRLPGGSVPPLGGGGGLAGLQTRASVNTLIQNQIAAGGPNAAEQIRNNMQAAQAELNKLKDKVLKAGGSSSDMNTWDNSSPRGRLGGAPNTTKTQTFKQRLEKGFNVQFAKNNSLVPTTADVAMHIGYKMNDKSVIGLGASYKAGLGSIQRIAISHQGVGLRSYIDWKLKKQFYISGGYEMNHNAQFRNIQQLQQYNSWQHAGLVGLTKKIPLKTKWTKGTKFQVLYDMLANRHVPVSQPVVLRVGYQF
jgi:Mg2+ and Co2+ transporter CorA